MAGVGGLLQLITLLVEFLAPSGGWHNSTCCRIEGLLQLFALNDLAE